MQPSDQVEVVYEVTGEDKGCRDLSRVIDAHRDYIQTTTKGPLVPRTGKSERRKLIGEDKQKVISLCHPFAKFAF